MTPEEQKILLIKIKDCLQEVLIKIQEVYGDTAYYQHIDYKATNDKYDNWLFRARKLIVEVDAMIE